jgi:RHS repeat-associated protein
VSILFNAPGVGRTVVRDVTYLPFGPLTSYRLGNDQIVTRTYDANYAVTDVTSPVLNLHFARDVMGNLVSLGAAAGATPATESYAYDPLYRLTSVNDASGTAIEAYTYNKTGDRLSKAAPGKATGPYGYQAGTHWLTSVGTDSRNYDANGNTTGSTTAGDALGYGYNGRNRMTVVQRNGATVGTYVYNALGERVSKTVTTPTASTTRFVYDQNSQLLAEYGAASRDIIWLDSLPIATVDGSGSASTFGYIHADALGTPRVVADANGATIWTWAFQGNSFGEPLPTSVGGYTLGPRFPGQYFDAESGLTYNVNRDYEAATGRYIQSDPIGLLGGVSTFGYGFANPHNFIDPLGLSGILVINSSGAGDGILGSGGVSGHSWVSYTPDGGQAATYGTWGNNPQGLPNGLEQNLELGRIGDATRAAQLTDEEEAAFYGVVNRYKGDGENAWGYLHPCSSFAADAWNSSTGESLSPNGPYSNPSSLKQSIIDANGGVNHGSIGPTPPSPWPQ